MIHFKNRKRDVEMKKLFLLIVLILLMTTPSHAAKLFVVTIKEVKPETVQDTLIEVFTGKNFTIDEVDSYKVTFVKSFTHGLLEVTRLNTVKCNVIARDGNVKLMVTQHEVIGGQTLRQRSIDHLIPMIVEVKNMLDGTPVDAIENEAVDQLPNSGNKREKKLGLTIGDNGRVTNIEAGSAAHGKITIGDIIYEINGISINDMDKTALRTYIANKWGAGASLIMMVEHEGEKKIVSIKKEN